jgi:oxalate decarboxylase
MSLKYRLELSTPHRFAGGTSRPVTVENLPELRGISLFSLHIDPGALRELHWHTNANELNYCLRGQGIIGIATPDGTSTSFPISSGNVTFIPRGATHYILNTGCEDLHLLVAFSNEQPERIDLSETLGFVPHNLLAQTFSIPPSGFPHLPQQGDQFLVRADGFDEGSIIDFHGSGGPYTVNIESIPPGVSAGGIVRQLTAEFIPSLKGITMFYLQGLPRALREPHWHPDAAELHYCVYGHAQIQIIGDSGQRENFTLEPGDVGHAPINYLHYVDSISDEPLVFLGFYSHEVPGSIDISQTFSYFPHGLLAASFSTNLHLFDEVPDRGDVIWAPYEEF